MKGNLMIIDFDELMKQEELYIENHRKADEWFIETLRERAFPTPSPFGVEWEKQRVSDAYSMIARWSQGRKRNGADLRDFRDETLWIMMVVLKSM
jgi:hypothetical protein